MNTKNLLTSHIDTSVLRLFIGVFAIAMTTLAFRISNDAPCDEAQFDHLANAYRAGEMVKFYDRTEDAQKWEWDFGDGSEPSTQKNPLHIYQSKGDYTIRLLINNSCQKEVNLHIDERLALLDTTKFPKFKIPKTIMVGEQLDVVDETENARSWEWRFGETATANATTRVASYVYEAPGLKTISLVVNNDLVYISKQKINVLPLPEEKEEVSKIDYKKRPKRDKRLDLNKGPAEQIGDKKPEESKPNVAPFISVTNFENKILMVANEKLSPQAFSKFFCGDVNPLVVVNGRNNTFLVFCEKIKGKKIKIKSIDLIRNAGSNCISTFTIEYKKSGLF